MTATDTAPPVGGASGDDLPKNYDPVAVEVPLYQRWLRAGYFHADEQRVLSGERKPFSIVLPPPNVNGDLHVGHALDHTLMDTLARWHRMSGDEVLWMPGMDHAGIAVQNAVEKRLAIDGKTRHDFGRELFVEKVWDWKQEYGGAILGQMKRLGDSVDWDRERFTLDDGLSAAVQNIFKKLYDDGLIYRAERIINWCPGCLTAISDIEVDHSDDPGELVSIRYDGLDADTNDAGPTDTDAFAAFSVVVATTRVETMLGDSAIAVHPDDERYAALVGKTVTLPLVNRQIPIVADAHVDPAFGTGAVKVTPAHDPNDFEIGRRHDLPMVNMLTEDAHIVGTGTTFDGMDRFEARVAVKQALRAEGRIVAEKIPYLHAVGHCSRSDDVIEPRLSLQWFVKVATLAQAAGDAVRDGQTSIHPSELAARYFDWVDNMHDWTISRQLWWGHRIPVWYGPDGEIRCVGPDDEAPGDGWVQDPDVLDTWFSSGLWPFSTMGWPERTDTLKAFYPTSVLVTGYDILFFWVARMMMLGLYAMADNEAGAQPFDVVMLHGLVRDQFGKKMSKSKGNGIDPLAWIEAYGADAVRFTLARGANPGTDQALAEDWVAGSRNFCSKLFNATKFAMINGATIPDSPLAATALTDADAWILDRLDEVVGRTTELLGDFQFAKAAEGLYHYAWDEFCDWYLELAKVQLRAGFDADPDRAQTTRAVLGTVLDTLLRLLHPFVPFVTETLWTTLTGGHHGPSLVIAAWPTPSGREHRPQSHDFISTFDAALTTVRQYRADKAVPPKTAMLYRTSVEAPIVDLLAAMGRLERSEDPKVFSTTGTLPIQVEFAGVTIAVEVSAAGAADLGAEKARLAKDLVTAEKEIATTDAKLTNSAFTSKAPEPVVAKIRVRNESAIAERERLRLRLAALEGQS
ncbi:MAG: valine--tRNA ligase [Actinomycetota bacterium]|nr:valine--tRNA ligase [Actinomycetota bacterium]